MKNLRIALLVFAVLVSLGIAGPAHAQNVWYPSTYTPQSIIFYNDLTGTGGGTSYSSGGTEGTVSATAGGSTSTSAGTAKVEVIYIVTFTWYGGPPPGSLVQTPKSYASGQTHPGTSGSATAYSYMNTAAFAGLDAEPTAPPVYSGYWDGSQTSISTPSPVSFTFACGAFAGYSGIANTETVTNVYFQ